ETVAAASGTAGGNADALEDRVLSALATPVDDAHEDAQWIIGRAAAISQRAGRLASCTDLWAFMSESHAGRLVDEAKLDRGATLFALFHGGREPEGTLGDARDVLVALRDDQHTTPGVLGAMLRDVFALPEGQRAALR